MPIGTLSKIFLLCVVYSCLHDIVLRETQKPRLCSSSTWSTDLRIKDRGFPLIQCSALERRLHYWFLRRESVKEKSDSIYKNAKSHNSLVRTSSLNSTRLGSPSALKILLWVTSNTEDQMVSKFSEGWYWHMKPCCPPRISCACATVLVNIISLPLVFYGFVILQNCLLGSLFSLGTEGIIHSLLMGTAGAVLYRFRKAGCKKYKIRLGL